MELWTNGALWHYFSNRLHSSWPGHRSDDLQDDLLDEIAVGACVWETFGRDSSELFVNDMLKMFQSIKNRRKDAPKNVKQAAEIFRKDQERFVYSHYNHLKPMGRL